MLAKHTSNWLSLVMAILYVSEIGNLYCEPYWGQGGMRVIKAVQTSKYLYKQEDKIILLHNILGLTV